MHSINGKRTWKRTIENNTRHVRWHAEKVLRPLGTRLPGGGRELVREHGKEDVMNTFTEADRFLMQGRDHDYRNVPSIRYTTVVRRDPDTIALRYHATDVVTWHRDGSTVLESGGWRTATTKERMNTYAPCTVGQDHGLWYVSPSRPTWEERQAAMVMYFDGITVNENGDVLNPRPPEERNAIEFTKRKVDRMVSGFISGFTKDAAENGIQEPSGGDCWHCSLRTAEERKPLGDAINDVSHLIEHMRERYYVPSLLWNAIVERGFGHGPTPIWRMIQIDIEQGRHPSFITDTLRSYLRRRKPQMVNALMCEAKESVA